MQSSFPSQDWLSPPKGTEYEKTKVEDGVPQDSVFEIFRVRLREGGNVLASFYTVEMAHSGKVLFARAAYTLTAALELQAALSGLVSALLPPEG